MAGIDHKRDKNKKMETQTKTLNKLLPGLKYNK